MSDERSHGAATVHTFIKALVPAIREDIEFNHVHYVTDSPSSQYRNLNMFSVLGTEASWLYIEAGHGKGPYDGVGGCSKRMADDYVRRSNSILTATQYAAYSNSSGKVKYIVISKEAVADGLPALEAIKWTSTVKGTMTYHAAVCPRPGVLRMRKTSRFWVAQIGTNMSSSNNWRMELTSNWWRSRGHLTYCSWR